MSHEPPNPFGPDWSALEATQAFIREGALREHMKRKVELEREVARLTKERDEAREHAERLGGLLRQAESAYTKERSLGFSAEKERDEARAALEEWKAEAAERDEAYRLAWKDKCEAENALVEARAALDAERAAHAETKRERTALCVTLEATEIVLQAAGFSIDDGLIEAVSAALAALATARREALLEVAGKLPMDCRDPRHLADFVRDLAAREGEKDDAG